tara:strand:+ start:169 stop:333 length:165 start_codon:yes stop_codon:yes gene_type:complete
MEIQKDLVLLMSQLFQLEVILLRFVTTLQEILIIRKQFRFHYLLGQLTKLTEMN